MMMMMMMMIENEMMEEERIEHTRLVVFLTKKGTHQMRMNHTRIGEFGNCFRGDLLIEICQTTIT